ncbi:hypothetical protein IJT10_08810 [bacterium]|nr:hypothetical protein [bacterium]
MLLFIFSYIWIGISPTLAQQRLICSVCKRPINGRYNRVNGKIVCFEDLRCSECGIKNNGGHVVFGDGRVLCENHLPKCSRCKRKIRTKAFIMGGQTVCEYCVTCSKCNRRLAGFEYYVDKQSRRAVCVLCARCSVCGNRVGSKLYLSTNGEPLCYRDIEKCSKCNVVLDKQKYKLGDKLFCQRDLPAVCPKCGMSIIKHSLTSSGEYRCHKTLICSTCGQTISGSYFVLLDNVAVCRKCKGNKNLHECFLCHVPISNLNAGLVFSDGRHSCKVHMKGAINTSKLGNYLTIAKKSLTTYVSPRLKIDDNIPLTIHCVDGNSLNSTRKHIKGMEDLDIKLILGVTKPRFVYDAVCDFQIWMLQGLPEQYFMTALVHECAHVWQINSIKYYSDVNKVTARDREGFANWVAYKYNQRMGRNEQLKYLDSATDPYYGEGLQYYKRIERRYGINGCIDYAVGKLKVDF